jgi:hypothetical protein
MRGVGGKLVLRFINKSMSLLNVSCADCKCLVRRWNAQVVSEIFYSHIGSEEARYYCAAHKKPYDFIVRGDYFKNEVPVDKTGVPIGYKKKCEECGGKGWISYHDGDKWVSNERCICNPKLEETEPDNQDL